MPPPLRFAANLGWLFQEEATLPQRMEAAARAGFRAAELSFPYACAAPELRAAAERAGLELVLLNTPPGNQEKGDRGLGAVPGRQPEFREALSLAVKYAKDLKCPRIHIMAGRMPIGAEREAVSAEMEATFVENLKYAADILAQENLDGLLEPINSRITDPQYFLTTPQQAAAILKKVGCPNLKLQLDIFHCQIMDGNLTQNLETYFPIIGHIQIAQVPTRHEPSSPGELNFPYLFQLLESKKYSGYVGCEYKPQGHRCLYDVDISFLNVTPLPGKDLVHHKIWADTQLGLNLLSRKINQPISQAQLKKLTVVLSLLAEMLWQGDGKL